MVLRDSKETQTGQPQQRRVVEIVPPSAEGEQLWTRFAQLASEFGAEEGWALVGGLMVQLHAYEHGSDSRPTRDIDLLGDARKRPSGTERLSDILDRLGAALPTPPATDPTTGYVFELEGETIEVLGPDGLKEDPRTIGSLRTIQVDGGTQALRRTEQAAISVAGAEPVVVRRPTLLGAILLKARALRKIRARREEHRQDLIRLLSFVEDPRELAAEGGLTPAEVRWLREIEADLVWDDPEITSLFSAATIDRARAAYEILTG